MSFNRTGRVMETLEYIRVEKYVLALIGSAIWPFQLEKLHSLRKIYSTRFQVIQKIWQMTWWSRNSSSFNFQLHFHPRNCELELRALFYFLLNCPTQVFQLFSFYFSHSKFSTELVVHTKLLKIKKGCSNPIPLGGILEKSLISWTAS